MEKKTTGWKKERTLVVWERSVLSLEKERPDVDIGDLDGRIGGGDRHGGYVAKSNSYSITIAGNQDSR